MDKKVRVLVADDSFLMRKIISDVINADPELEVVDKAKNGKEALEKTLTLRPDVLTLDVNLPLLDGISVLEEIMRKQPTPVIMISAYTRQGTSATIKALELGALDFIAKPSGEISLDIYKLKDEIVYKIKLAAKVDLDKFLSTVTTLPLLGRKKTRPATIKKLVVIGASSGGPRAILEIMQDIPSDIAAAFLIVQHMPRGFTSSFAERISWQSEIKTKEAEDGDIVEAGKAFVAASGYHLVLEGEEEKLKLRLNQDAPVNFMRPSIDVTMQSCVNIFGNNVIGVILTGMGRDGLDGARRIKEKEGLVIVQDEKTSMIWGMPKAVYDAGLADKVLSVSEIAGAIIQHLQNA